MYKIYKNNVSEETLVYQGKYAQNVFAFLQGALLSHSVFVVVYE